MKKARILARSPTYAVLVAPSTLRIGNTHEKVLLIYAILVDPTSGRVDTVLWAIPDGGNPTTTAPVALKHLAPRLVYPCGVDVAADRFLGTVPVSWSFAMRALPPGLEIETPSRLRPWLTDPARIGAKPDAFERLLRAEITLDRPSGRPSGTFQDGS